MIKIDLPNLPITTSELPHSFIWTNDKKSSSILHLDTPLAGMKELGQLNVYIP